jgi:hypothetical protein
MPIDAQESPTAMLTRLCEERASGEVVAAAPSLEVHIYLYEGRVAWATSSRAPNALLRSLLDNCGLDRSAVAEVVAECRRTRRRFGETLIEWGVATEAQVREALRDQIAGSIESLLELGAVRAIFLPRRLEYTQSLTFELDQVCPPTRVGEPDDRLEELRANLVSALPNALWVETSDAATTDDDERRRYLSQISRAARDVEAQQLTLRCRLGAVLGRAAGSGGWLYCGVGEASAAALAQAVLSHVVGAIEREPYVPAGERGVLVADNDAVIAGLAPATAALEQSPELCATLVHSVGRDQRACAHRADIRIDELERKARIFGEALTAPLTPVLGVRDEISALAWERVSIQIGSSQHNLFGTLLECETPTALWICVAPSASVGLGWALLTTLTRQLEELVER